MLSHGTLSFREWFLGTEDEHGRAGNPLPREELGHGPLDLGRSEVLFSLALVHPVRRLPTGEGVQVDALLTLPADAVQLAVGNVAVQPCEAEAEPLEILPGELTEGEFLWPRLDWQRADGSGRGVKIGGQFLRRF